MIDPRELGNRHLRPASGLKDSSEATAIAVRIIISDDWGTSRAGQLLVSCLVNLLCRQAGIVRRIELIAKPTPLLIRLPSGSVTTPFPKCLEDLAHWAVGDVVVVSTNPDEYDYAIVVGDAACDAKDAVTLSVVGDGWCAWVGERIHAPAAVKPHFDNPLGPFLAAALVAGEVFKRSRGILRGRYLAADGFSLWSGEASADWYALPQGPDLSGHVMPPTHIVGAGAVGNGFAYIALYAGFSDAYLIAVDDDGYDGTNLNRCLVAGCRDVGHSKVDAITRLLNSAGVSTFPFPKTISDYIADQHVGLRADAAQQVSELDFRIVLSCVDKGVSRQHVQGLHPRLLAGASTLDLRAQSNVYGLWRGSACLGCYNAVERDGDKLRAIERHVRELPESDRRDFFLANRLDVDAIEQYLADPKCGAIGEAALRDFAVRPPQTFSTGFVSLGAALLLASTLFRHILFQPETARSDMTTLNFLNGGFMDSGLGADPNCELGCERYTTATNEARELS